MTVQMEASPVRSVACRLASCCDDDRVFVVVGPDGSGEYFIRIFGHSKTLGMVGLAHLLTEEESESLGLSIYRFQPGGIRYSNMANNRESVQAIAVRVWRHLKPNAGYPNVIFL